MYQNVSNDCKFENSCEGKAFYLENKDLYFECIQEKYSYDDDTFEWHNFYAVGTKIIPSYSDIKNYKSKGKTPTSKSDKSYGTGFSLATNFCYHVVKDAKEITIKGINGRTDTVYKAEIEYFDEGLDIAVLKIVNSNSKVLSKIPYPIKHVNSEVGENVFVLGYPLHSTMGNEIKLTTGIISSNSGYLDNKNLLQISAPIQPGNSGGPLFDNKGNLIGIVTSKHIGTENVGYALKISTLFDLLKNRGISFEQNKIEQLELPKKVKLFKDFIYSIEVISDNR